MLVNDDLLERLGAMAKRELAGASSPLDRVQIWNDALVEIVRLRVKLAQVRELCLQAIDTYGGSWGETLEYQQILDLDLR